MKRIEFYRTPSGEVTLDYQGGDKHEYRESDREFTLRMLEILDTFYQKALKGLRKWFANSKSNQRYYDFLCVRQFILCNFGEYDSHIDLDEFDNFNFEFVHCTIRATCLYNGYVKSGEPNELAICNPEFNSVLSEAELRTLRPFYENIRITREEVAEMNYIALNTVNNHLKSAMRKTELNNLSQLITYARQNNIFK